MSVVDSTKPLLEPKIYRNRDAHANHYTTDEMCVYLIMDGLRSDEILVFIITLNNCLATRLTRGRELGACIDIIN